MPPMLFSLLFFAGFFLFLIICLELGHLFGLRNTRDEKGVSTVDGAVFALVGFLLAFAFAGAQTRLQTRRSVLADEANAIGTAFLRVDLASEDAKETLRRLFRDYTEARIAGTAKLPNLEAASIEWEKASQIGREIWSASVAGTSDHPLATPQLAAENRGLLLDAVNTMLDKGTEREVAVRTHLPVPVMLVLGLLTGLAALLAGRGMACPEVRPRFHRVVLASVFACVLTLLVDLEYPRVGWVQLGAGDYAMESVRQLVGGSK